MKIFGASVGGAVLLQLFVAASFVHAMKPRNDKCRGAKVVPTLDLPYLDVVNFTEYPRSPKNGTSPSCANVTKEVWYQYTPTTDGVLTVFARDYLERFFLKPGVDISLAASTGSCNDLTEVKCYNFEFGSDAFEFFYPVVRAGITYYIQVGDIGNVGTGLVNVTFAFDAYDINVSGDECTDAKMIPHAALPFNEVVDTRLYTNNPKDVATTCQFGGSDGNTVWYKYKPPSDGLFIVDTRGSLHDIPFTTRHFAFTETELDLQLGAYTGSCNNLKPIFCTDEDQTEQMFLPVKQGEIYTIKVGQSLFYELFGLGPTNVTMSFRRNYFNLVAEGKPIAVLNDIYNGEYVDSRNKYNILNYGLINTTKLGLEAVFASPVQSVRLQLGNQKKTVCDNSKPFLMLGTAGQMNVPYALGQQVITATAYARPNCTGKVLSKVSQDFLVRGCNNLQYGMYDASREKYITTVNNASMIDNPPCQVNLGVTFQCGFKPDKVRLELRRVSNNALVASRDETRAPYFLFGDDNQGGINPGSIPAGEYFLTAIINNVAHPSVRFTMGECKGKTPLDFTFDIDIRFDFFGDTSSRLSEYQTAKLFHPIVERISSLIVEDRPDFTNTSFFDSDFFCGEYPSRIDDLYICAVIGNYDDGESGILGFLLESYKRPSDNLPVTGTIAFDATSFERLRRNGNAESYILQQLIRTLGLGESWSAFGLAELLPPCSYNGTKAKAEFAAITGCSSDIPLDQGTLPLIDGYGDYTFDCRFWDPSCLQNEVLTFTLGKKKISRITLGALEDLGYVVNYTAADPYGMNDIGTCTGCNIRRNLKHASKNDENTKSKSSCHSGIVHQRALRHGRKMLRDVDDHHMKQGKPTTTPEGFMYVGNQRITVMYEHEDGMLCSVDVHTDDLL